MHIIHAYQAAQIQNCTVCANKCTDRDQIVIAKLNQIIVFFPPKVKANKHRFLRILLLQLILFIPPNLVILHTLDFLLIPLLILWSSCCLASFLSLSPFSSLYLSHGFFRTELYDSQCVWFTCSFLLHCPGLVLWRRPQSKADPLLQHHGQQLALEVT